eukprot:CAMPEP_0114998236 /NCGR_PEP_ID=MMETSP0216-20121206/15378_1 /TAXON_ID=223996 /ORGANISM="Protocruzia adherens, Strain Boccale" /LENGTH=473 /DNA_ID=CAMNT_0002362777 /DNA_START=37 /DNA_END=1458 /DNA_ORIENTATION=+
MGEICSKPTALDWQAGSEMASSQISRIYEFKEVLGVGRFGMVKRAIRRSNPSQVYAIKMLCKCDIKDSLQFVKNEVDILRNLDHPNIVKFFEVYEDSRYLYIVMEYIKGEELLERIIKDHSMEESHVASILYTVVSAIKYCHSNNILHNDLQPKNFLFSERSSKAELKIIDFGLAEEATHTYNSDVICGTPQYMAPEAFDGRYGTAGDMWSLGCITYLLLAGFPPFWGKRSETIYQKIRRCDFTYDFPCFEVVTAEAKDFISKLLVKNPQKRMSAIEALEHPWLHALRGPLRSSSRKMTVRSFKTMKSFALQSQLAKDALARLVIVHLPKAKREVLKEKFRELDRDNTGVISYANLEEGLREAGLSMKSDEIHNLIKKIDFNQNNEINYTEFLAATIDAGKHLTEDMLYSAFKYYDTDDSGEITTDNLKEVLKRTGREDVTDIQIKQMVEEVDTDGNGRISFEEFLDALHLNS